MYLTPAKTNVPAARMLTLFFAFCAASAGLAHGQLEEAVRSFDEGNTRYRDGDYGGSIEAYQEAIRRGYTGGALYYNLGNAYFRNDELGQAIRYYEKARQFIPENKELQHNLAFAQSQTVDRISQLPVPWWIQWWRSNLVLSGGRWLLWIGLIFYASGIALYIHRMQTRTRNPWFRRMRAAAILLAGLLLAGAFAASIQSERNERAVVISESLPLQIQPSRESDFEITIHEGLIVDVLQQNGNWIEIRLPNGTRGWVEQDAVADV